MFILYYYYNIYNHIDAYLPYHGHINVEHIFMPKKRRKTKQHVCDLQSWLEAWNIYLAIQIQTASKTALQLVCQLFSAYPVHRP